MHKEPSKSWVKQYDQRDDFLHITFVGVEGSIEVFNGDQGVEGDRKVLEENIILGHVEALKAIFANQ